MSLDYERVVKHIDNSRKDCMKRDKDHNWRINNQQIFNLIEGYVDMYNLAWNYYLRSRNDTQIKPSI